MSIMEVVSMLLEERKTKYLFYSPFISGAYLLYLGKLSEIWLSCIGVVCVVLDSVLKILSIQYLGKKRFYHDEIKTELTGSMSNRVAITIFSLIVVWSIAFVYTNIQLYKIGEFYSNIILIVNVLVFLGIVIQGSVFNLTKPLKLEEVKSRTKRKRGAR